MQHSTACSRKGRCRWRRATRGLVAAARAAAPAQRQLLVNLLVEHVAWVVTGGAWDVTVCGRAHEELRRPGGDALPEPGRHGRRGAPAPGDPGQREGDFRLVLSTDLKSATAYVSLPHFDAQGRPQPSALPRDVNRPPPR